jgi:multiple sugar transport system substrate-binding protein
MDSSQNTPRPGRWRRCAALAASLLLITMLLAVLAVPGPAVRQYPQRIPVRLWHMWTAEWKVVVDRIVQRFNESQDRYELIALSVPSASADSKFLLAVAGGDPPDVMAQWNQVIPKWAESGLIVPLDELMTPAEREAFERDAYPIARKIGTYKGRPYGITTGLNTWACYYLPQHLREAGLDPDHFPDTLEELVAWGDKLHRFDRHGNLVRLGFMPEWFTMYAPVFGKGFYDEATGAVTIDTLENLRALTFLVDCRRKLGFENVVRFRSGLSTGFAAEWPFISGAYSITLDGQWRVEQLARYAPNLEYRTAPLPPPQGGRSRAGWSNGNFMIIPRGAAQPAGAFEFIKFWSGLANPQRAAEFYTWGGWLPLRRAIADAPVYRQYVRKHPPFQTFVDLLPSENLQPTPPVPYQVYLWDRIGQIDDSAMRGTLTPAEALRTLREDIELEQAQRRALGYAD